MNCHSVHYDTCVVAPRQNWLPWQTCDCTHDVHVSTWLLHAQISPVRSVGTLPLRLVDEGICGCTDFIGGVVCCGVLTHSTNKASNKPACLQATCAMPCIGRSLLPRATVA